MLNLLKFIKYLLISLLSIILILVGIAVLSRFVLNPEMKGISIVDLRHIAFLFFPLLIILIIINFVLKREINKTE